MRCLLTHSMAGDAEAASTLLHAAQDLCAYQAAVGEHYCCPIALPFSMLPCLLATQSGVCDPAAVVIHSSTLCKVCVPSAGSGKKMTWKSVGREACGPHWMGRPGRLPDDSQVRSALP